MSTLPLREIPCQYCKGTGVVGNDYDGNIEGFPCPACHGKLTELVEITPEPTEEEWSKGETS